MKGVAGNLGIKGVQFAAEKLEKAIRENDGATPSILKDFASLLHQQIASLERAFGESPAPSLDNGVKKNLDPVSVAREIERLRRLLDASDGDSEETFRALQGTLSGHVEKARLDALSADIGEFEFSGAIKKLDEIAKQLALNGKEVKG